MKRRLAGLLIVGIIGSIVGVAGAATCATVRTQNSGVVHGGGFTVAFSENQNNNVCDDGSVTQGALEQNLTISDASGVLCSTSNVDPSFDPFFFGGGVHNKAVNPSCYAEISAASIPNPLTPDVDAVQVDPSGSAQAGTRRDVVTDITSEVGGTWGSGTIPQDSTGVVRRQVKVLA